MRHECKRTRQRSRRRKSCMRRMSFSAVFNSGTWVGWGHSCSQRLAFSLGQVREQAPPQGWSKSSVHLFIGSTPFFNLSLGFALVLFCFGLGLCFVGLLCFSLLRRLLCHRVRTKKSVCGRLEFAFRLCCGASEREHFHPPKWRTFCTSALRAMPFSK